jgi:hypothetical protein
MGTCGCLWGSPSRHKPSFLAEPVRICENEMLPLLVGGDFNIIRRKEEKNNENFHARW